MRVYEMPDSAEIYDLLYRLGATATHTGFFHVACAIRLVIQQPERILLVTKWLYPEVAKCYKTNWLAVEQNIRRTIREIWEKDNGLLSELAGTPILIRPKPTEFIQLLANYLKPICVA